MENGEAKKEQLREDLRVLFVKMTTEAERSIKKHYDEATGLLVHAALQGGGRESEEYMEALARIEVQQEQALASFKEFQKMYQQKLEEFMATGNPNGMVELLQLAEDVVRAIEESDREFLKEKQAITPLFEWLTFDDSESVKPERRTINMWRAILKKFGLIPKETIQ